MMRVHRGPLLALAGLLLCLLAGCSTKPETDKQPTTQAQLAPADMARRGDFIGARSALEKMSARDFESELLLASVALRLNDNGTAVSAALRARSLAGADTDKLFRADLMLGEAFLADDKPDDALTAFSAARRLAPSMHERDRAIVCCARAELARGGVAAARRLRDEILRPDIPELADLDRRLARNVGTSAARTPASNTGVVGVASGRIERRPAGKGIAPPPIVSRAAWGAKPIKLRNEPDPIGRIERVTVHHTADPNGVPGASLIENVARVKAYQSAHQDDKHWADIGYHFIIDRQGRIFEGRELCWQGAHAGNEKANLHNVGIAVMGNFDRIKPSDAQQVSLEKLMGWLVAEYSLSRAAVAGHDDVRRVSTGSGTKCPGKNLDALLEKWKRAR